LFWKIHHLATLLCTLSVLKRCKCTNKAVEVVWCIFSLFVGQKSLRNVHIRVYALLKRVLKSCQKLPNRWFSAF
jgi:hypothetical protein